MRNLFVKGLAFLLALTLVFTPGMVRLALAQDDSDGAPQDQVKTLQQLAQKGYLGDKKDAFLSAKNPGDDDITDALVTIYQGLSQLDLKNLKPDDPIYKVDDLKALHQLVEDKKEDILARKVSAWKFEKRIEKMMGLLDPSAAPASTASAAAQAEEKPAPLPTATPIPGPSKEEVDQLRDELKDLSKKTTDMQDSLEKRLAATQKSNGDLKQSNDELEKMNADSQEQLKLVKKLMDQVQADLQKTDEHLETVAQKANEKSITDTELQQELEVMHKDVRDNSQDVSILKQEVAKLDKSGEKAGQSPLDDILGSKWLAGGALVVGVTALIISLTRK